MPCSQGIVVDVKKKSLRQRHTVQQEAQQLKAILWKTPGPARALRYVIALELTLLGWLSKLWSPFGSPKYYRCCTITGSHKRDHNFDKHPLLRGLFAGLVVQRPDWHLERNPKGIWLQLCGDHFMI